MLRCSNILIGIYDLIKNKGIIITCLNLLWHSGNIGWQHYNPNYNINIKLSHISFYNTVHYILFLRSVVFSQKMHNFCTIFNT